MASYKSLKSPIQSDRNLKASGRTDDEISSNVFRPQYLGMEKKKRLKSKGSTISNPSKGKTSTQTKNQIQSNKANSPSSKIKRTTVKSKTKIQVSINGV